jgi:hypothetical protein
MNLNGKSRVDFCREGVTIIVINEACWHKEFKEGSLAQSWIEEMTKPLQGCQQMPAAVNSHIDRE